MHGLFVLQILSSVAHFDYCWQEFILSICCWSHTHYQTGRFLLFSVVNHLCDCRPYLHVLNLFLLALVQYFWTILVFSLAVTLCLFPDIGVSKENIFRWEIDIHVVSKFQKNVCPETLLIFWTLLLLCSVFVLLGEWLEGISTCRTREKNSQLFLQLTMPLYANYLRYGYRM